MSLQFRSTSAWKVLHLHVPSSPAVAVNILVVPFLNHMHLSISSVKFICVVDDGSSRNTQLENVQSINVSGILITKWDFYTISLSKGSGIIVEMVLRDCYKQKVARSGAKLYLLDMIGSPHT